MKAIIPKAAVIHGITGFGRSSLSVVIPVLSSMGVQACPMPTAVLSSHPGGFKNFSFHELTTDMESYIDCWQKENITFDCIYSGFLGSAKQIDLVAELIDRHKRDKDHLVVVDPVMGDYGSLYKITDEGIRNKMRSLVGKADVITPNLTEACILLDEDYIDKPMDAIAMKAFLKRLSDMGPENVVITSVKTINGEYANIGYDRKQNIYWKAVYEHVPANYPGTGDIFASALTGYLLRGSDLSHAMAKATRFISMAVHRTYEASTPVREGILLEAMLPELDEENDEINAERL